MKNTKLKVAILGATSHIAKGLIFHFKDDESIELHCYARDLEKVKSFSRLINYKNPILKSFHELNDDHLDAVINCIGITYTSALNSLNENVFELTEIFDNIVLNYIRQNPETTYINFSSGAVYGTSFNQPASLNTKTIIDVNNILSEDYYRIAKLNSEAKHRSLNDFNIIDLRIFGYYSRFIDLTKNYLMTDILSSIRENRTLKTRPTDIIRDYIHPKDLSKLVKACFEAKKINEALDVRSKYPVSKMEILNFFKQNYNLNFEIDENYVGYSATGEKLNYYSAINNSVIIKLKPDYSSIECIAVETEELLKYFNYQNLIRKNIGHESENSLC